MQKVRRELFTGRESHVAFLKRLLGESRLETSIWMVYGPGGRGKSWLLGQFEDICRERSLPIAIMRGEDIRYDSIAFLKALRDQLGLQKGRRSPFYDFDRVIGRFLQIEAKILRLEKPREQSWVKKLATEAAKGAVTGAAGAGVGFLIGGPVGAIPAGILGAMIEHPSGKGLEATIKRLNEVGFSRQDVEFLLTFEDTLCAAFARAISTLVEQSPVVLIIDAYECLEHLDDWIRTRWLPKLVASKVLIILAGQYPLEGWKWRTCEAVFWQEELRAFSKDEAVQYWKRRGIEDPAVIKEGYNRTKGLPLGVARWAEIQHEVMEVDTSADSSEGGTKLTAYVVKWLFKRSTDEQLKELLRICSVPRWFNQDTLQTLLDREDVGALFDRLQQRSDFFRIHKKGLAMYEDIKMYVASDLHRRSPERFREINQGTLNALNKELANVERDLGRFSLEWQELILEILYHEFQESESNGIRILNKLVQGIRGAYRVSFFAALLADVASYAMGSESKTWLQFYSGLLAYDQGQWEKAKDIWNKIVCQLDLDDHLRSVLLNNLGIVHYHQGDLSEAIGCYEASIAINRELGDDVLLAYTTVRLGAEIYRSQGKWDELMKVLKASIDIFRQHTEYYACARTLLELGNLYRLKGEWEPALDQCKEALELFQDLDNLYDVSRALYTIGRIYMQMGELSQALEQHQRSLKILKPLGISYGVGMVLRNLADVYREQGNYKESLKCYQKSLKIFEKLGARMEFARVLGDLGTLHGRMGNDSEALDYYEQCLKMKEQLDDEYGIGYTQYYLGLLFLQRDDWDKAYEYLNQSLAVMKKYGNLQKQGEALVALCKISLVAKDHYGRLDDYLEEAARVAEVAKFYNQMAETAYFKGISLLRKERYMEAYSNLKESYDLALSHGPDYSMRIANKLIVAIEDLKKISRGHALQLCRYLISSNSERPSVPGANQFDSLLQDMSKKLAGFVMGRGKRKLRISEVLARVDSIIQEGIHQKIFPGAAIWINWQGNVLKRSTYGYTSYDQSQLTTINMLYDLASLTKVIVSTTAMMQLIESGRLGLNDKVANYIPEFGDADAKSKVTVRHLLTHTSGLPVHVKLYKQYRGKQGIISAICRLRLESQPGSRRQYCDVGYILLGEIISRVTELELDQYARRFIFDPLGMSNTAFNPLKEIPGNIAPTEVVEWRGGQIQGEVHDENAWAMGGIAGHAGLFSTVEDLAVFCEMLLKFGINSNGHRFLKSSTVSEMLRNQASGGVEAYGVGWELNQKSFMGKLASLDTFGHTGFTGTSIIGRLVDGLAIVFLTNRVCPSRNGPDINPYRQKIANCVADLLRI